MRDVSGGAERVRAWPRRRPGKPTKAQQEAREKFAQAQKMARYLAPNAMAEAMRQVENSPLLPRDFLTMMAFGTLYAADTDDGRTIWPMAARREVSEALDVLGSKPGSVLRRGDKYWDAIETPNPSSDGPFFALATLSGNWATAGSGWEAVEWDAVAGDPLNWFDSATGNFEPSLPGWYLCLARLFCSSGSLTNTRILVGGSGARFTGVATPSAANNNIVAGPVNIATAGTSLNVAGFFASGTVLSGNPQSTWLGILGPF